MQQVFIMRKHLETTMGVLAAQPRIRGLRTSGSQAPQDSQVGGTAALVQLHPTAQVHWVLPAPLPECLTTPSPSLSLGLHVLLFILPYQPLSSGPQVPFPLERGSRVFIQPVVPVGEPLPTRPPHWPVKPIILPVLRTHVKS